MVDARSAEWSPLPQAELGALLAAQPARWWIAGGIALELFAQRSWRAHGDVDAGILRSDQPAVFASLNGWERFAANSGELHALFGAEIAPPEVNSVWCRRAGEEAFRFELLLDGSDGDEWIFPRDSRVRLPLADLVLRSPDGYPFLRPEVQLLYKAKVQRDVDEEDFAVVAPLLDQAARRWLRAALALVDPRNDWVARL